LSLSSRFEIDTLSPDGYRSGVATVVILVLYVGGIGRNEIYDT